MPAVLEETAQVVESEAINNNDAVIDLLQTFTANITSSLDALKSEVANLKCEFTELKKRKDYTAEELILPSGDGSAVTLEQFKNYVTVYLPPKLLFLSTKKFPLMNELKKLVSDLSSQVKEERSVEDIIRLKHIIEGIFKSKFLINLYFCSSNFFLLLFPQAWFIFE